MLFTFLSYSFVFVDFLWEKNVHSQIIIYIKKINFLKNSKKFYCYSKEHFFIIFSHQERYFLRFGLPKGGAPLALRLYASAGNSSGRRLYHTRYTLINVSRKFSFNRKEGFLYLWGQNFDSILSHSAEIQKVLTSFAEKHDYINC